MDTPISPGYYGLLIIWAFSSLWSYFFFKAHSIATSKDGGWSESDRAVWLITSIATGPLFLGIVAMAMLAAVLVGMLSLVFKCLDKEEPASW